MASQWSPMALASIGTLLEVVKNTFPQKNAAMSVGETLPAGGQSG